jgi:hypothetical protein
LSSEGSGNYLGCLRAEGKIILKQNVKKQAAKALMRFVLQTSNFNERFTAPSYQLHLTRLFFNKTAYRSSGLKNIRC